MVKEFSIAVSQTSNCIIVLYRFTHHCLFKRQKKFSTFNSSVPVHIGKLKIKFDRKAHIIEKDESKLVLEFINAAAAILDLCVARNRLFLSENISC